jgi:hypothetical protein
VPDLTLIMSDNDNDEQDTDLAPTMQAPEQVHAWSDETDESDLTSADSGHTDRRILVLTSANVG